MFHKKLLTSILALLAVGSFAQQITQKEKQAIFDSTQKLFTRNYHFKKPVQPTVDYLNQKWKAGRYETLTTLPLFINSLSKDLKHFTHDGHLNFFYLPVEIASDTTPKPSVPFGLLNEQFLNEGLNTVQVLPGNIGYFKIQSFGDHAGNKDVVAAAFTFLKNTSAMLIDLRGNGGGALSNMVSSYLLPEDSIHLNTIFWNDHTDSIFSYRKLDGPRYLNKPVYLLTDKATFSSAEEFAYDLQNLKRVTIVGETTGGGANPGGTLPVYRFSDGAQLHLFVPTAHVENPISKTNWEGKGVQPDVLIDGKEALQKAHLLALEHLKQQEKNKVVQNRYTEIINKVQTGKQERF